MGNKIEDIAIDASREFRRFLRNSRLRSWIVRVFHRYYSRKLDKKIAEMDEFALSLKGEPAERFEKKAEENLKNKHSVDFREQYDNSMAILKKREKEREEKTLKLVLKKKWYDMIASGEKTEEYREIKQYWGKRLTDLPGGDYLFSYRNGYQSVPFKTFDKVVFYLGYDKDRPSMTFKIKEITIGKGRPEWGAENDKEYYIIKLKERL